MTLRFSSKARTGGLTVSRWQYTSEVHDEHTRSVLLRGGSNYGPWRGKECRWIDNNDGTPNDVAPACFNNTSTAAVPGSTPHLMGGSHWYFPQAYDITTYNKYFLMSGSYERAGTIGFRCVADAVDDCGNGGHLCPATAPVPASAALGPSFAEDWVLFGADSSSSPLGAVSKAEPAAGFKIAPLKPLESSANVTILPNAGAVAFSWTGGDSPATGATKATLAFLGPDAGFTVEAPAPRAGASNTLTLYVGSRVGAQGNLSAHVANVPGAAVSLLVASGASVLQLKYMAGPLLVQYSVVPGSVCDSVLCIKAPVTSLPNPVLLSPPGVLDWALWGGCECSFPFSAFRCVFLCRLLFCSSALRSLTQLLFVASADSLMKNADPEKVPGWYPETMEDGPGLLVPKLIMPAGAPSDLKDCSNTPSFSFTGGTPTHKKVGAPVKSGVFSVKGTFSMTIPTNGTEVARELTLYVGLFGTLAARLTASSPGQPTITKVLTSNGGTTNAGLTIKFTGALTVTWGKDDDEDGGNVTWQAAMLAAGVGGMGGVTVQALTLASQVFTR